MIRWARHRLDELRVGLMFLTRLPVGQVARQVPLAETGWAWPLAGVAVGLVFAAGYHLALWLGLSVAVASVLGMCAALVATGGLHEDGLADLADGVGGGAAPERRLEIMRDSRLGSYGAMALILCFLLTALLWQGLPPAQVLPVAIAAGLASRMALPFWAATMPMARPGGLGAATKGMSRACQLSALVIGVGGLALCLPFAQALAMGGAVIVTQLLMCLYARRTLGGITGDVLGAAQVLSQVVALMTVAGA